MHCRHASRHAFTLLEMLCAVVIMAFLVVLLFGAFHQGQRGWVSAQTRAEVYQEGRGLLVSIAQEAELALTNARPVVNSSEGILEFVSPISQSGQWLTTGTNDIVELCWVKYQYWPGSPVGSLTCMRSGPSLTGGTHNKVTFVNKNYGSPVMLSSNVVNAWFANEGNRLIRIHLEVLDPVTVGQIQASGNRSLTNRVRVLETAVGLVPSP